MCLRALVSINSQSRLVREWSNFFPKTVSVRKIFSIASHNLKMNLEVGASHGSKVKTHFAKKKKKFPNDKGLDKMKMDQARKNATHFICVKISNPKILEKIKDCQALIVKREPKLQTAIVQTEKAHVTLLVMHLSDKSEVERASTILKEVITEFNDFTENLLLHFEGLGNFNHKVVYVKVNSDENLQVLQDFAQKLYEKFEMENFHLCSDKSLTAHLTICKLSRDHKLFKKGVKKISKELYSCCEEEEFGEQEIDGFQLCAIGVAASDGYYHICSNFPLQI